MTAGSSVLKGTGAPIMTGGGEMRGGANRGSLTHLSQLTPSQQPLTGEDRTVNLPLNFVGSQLAY